MIIVSSLFFFSSGVPMSFSFFTRPYFLYAKYEKRVVMMTVYARGRGENKNIFILLPFFHVRAFFFGMFHMVELPTDKDCYINEPRIH